jgi:hypothetical protein
MTQWPQGVESDRVLAAAWHDLSHFAVDEDIPRKDERYARYQRELLSRRVSEIKTSCGLA